MKKYMFDKNAKLMEKSKIISYYFGFVVRYHYKSWINSKNCLLIKYEDIVNNKKIIAEKF